MRARTTVGVAAGAEPRHRPSPVLLGDSGGLAVPVVSRVKLDAQ
jgi:hypothetical protein